MRTTPRLNADESERALRVGTGVLQRLGDAARRHARAALFGAGLLLGADQLLAAPHPTAQAARKPTRAPAVAAATSDDPLWAQQLGVTDERRIEARRTLNRALRHPAVLAHAREAASHPDDIYALHIKESALRADAHSRGGAHGLAQLQEIARAEVERHFGVRLSRTDPVENVVCGILYLQTRLDEVGRLFPEERSEAGRWALALMDYNAGARLLLQLKRDGDTYATFAARVEEDFARSVGANPQQRLTEADPVFGVQYRIPAGLKKYRERGGGYGPRVAKIAEMLPYPRIIQALAVKLSAPPPAWIAPPQGGGGTLERITENRRLWSITYEKLGLLVNRIPGYTQRMHKQGATRGQMHRALMRAVLEYNAVRVTDPEQVDLQPGTQLRFPDIATLQASIGKILLSDPRTDPALRRAYEPQQPARPQAVVTARVKRGAKRAG